MIIPEIKYTGPGKGVDLLVAGVTGEVVGLPSEPLGVEEEGEGEKGEGERRRLGGEEWREGGGSSGEEEKHAGHVVLWDTAGELGFRSLRCGGAPEACEEGPGAEGPWEAE